jgi:hypothetical protein
MRRLVGDTKSNGDRNMSGAGRKTGGDMNRITGGRLPQNIIGEYPAAAKHPNNRQAQAQS